MAKRLLTLRDKQIARCLKGDRQNWVQYLAPSSFRRSPAWLIRFSRCDRSDSSATGGKWSTSPLLDDEGLLAFDDSLVKRPPGLPTCPRKEFA